MASFLSLTLYLLLTISMIIESRKCTALIFFGASHILTTDYQWARTIVNTRDELTRYFVYNAPTF